MHDWVVNTVCKTEPESEQSDFAPFYNGQSESRSKASGSSPQPSSTEHTGRWDSNANKQANKQYVQMVSGVLNKRNYFSLGMHILFKRTCFVLKDNVDGQVAQRARRCSKNMRIS